jgi:N-acetylglucosaminyldiphosphoundecaprenol N-acetyl-beta-D-mannosaminyltransferase
LETASSIDNSNSLIDPCVREDFLGAPIDCLTLIETVAAADAAIRSKRTCQHVCLNVAKFVKMRADAELDRDVRSSHIISADGVGIVWAARLLGIDVPERVAGVDLMEAVLRLCANNGYRPYFLGASRDILKQAITALHERYPSLTLAGASDGYFKPEEELGIVGTIKSSRADCLFIGMPTPRKERFLARHRDELAVPFVMGVGGAFDILAGHVHRAPGLVQRVGLEWLYRTVQEPFRLGPRYAKTNLAFAVIVTKAVMRRAAAACRVGPIRRIGKA